jgi:mRNA interferase MazF
MKNNKQERTPVIGEIYIMYFCGSGSEQSGWRPGVVFQNNLGNAKSPNIIALPLTTSLKKLTMPTHVLLKAAETGLRYDSMVLCENTEKMSKDKMGGYLTTLSEEQMSEIAKANLLATSAISFLDKETLINIWRKSLELNNCFA